MLALGLWSSWVVSVSVSFGDLPQRITGRVVGATAADRTALLAAARALLDSNAGNSSDWPKGAAPLVTNYGLPPEINGSSRGSPSTGTRPSSAALGVDALTILLTAHARSHDTSALAAGTAAFRALLAYQRADGLLPHTIFAPAAAEQRWLSPGFVPGPATWWNKSSRQRGAAAIAAPRTEPGHLSSPLAALPLHGMVALSLFNNTSVNGKPDDANAFVCAVFEPLYRWTAYLYARTGAAKTGLVPLRHPWEGLPTEASDTLWQELLSKVRVAQRLDVRGAARDATLAMLEDAPRWFWRNATAQQWPLPPSSQSGDAADARENGVLLPELWLLRCLADAGFEDEAAMTKACGPSFLVADVAFNSVLLRSTRALRALPLLLGRHVCDAGGTPAGRGPSDPGVGTKAQLAQLAAWENATSIALAGLWDGAGGTFHGRVVDATTGALGAPVLPPAGVAALDGMLPILAMRPIAGGAGGRVFIDDDDGGAAREAITGVDALQGDALVSLARKFTCYDQAWALPSSSCAAPLLNNSVAALPNYLLHVALRELGDLGLSGLVRDGLVGLLLGKNASSCPPRPDFRLSFASTGSGRPRPFHGSVEGAWANASLAAALSISLLLQDGAPFVLGMPVSSYTLAVIAYLEISVAFAIAVSFMVLSFLALRRMQKVRARLDCSDRALLTPLVFLSCSHPDCCCSMCDVRLRRRRSSSSCTRGAARRCTWTRWTRAPLPNWGCSKGARTMTLGGACTAMTRHVSATMGRGERVTTYSSRRTATKSSPPMRGPRTGMSSRGATTCLGRGFPPNKISARRKTSECLCLCPVEPRERSA